MAINLENKNKGGKAELIMTSLIKEKVKWENIFIQGEEKSKKKKDKNESLNNSSSKIIVILYNDNITNEWLGVAGEYEKDFDDKDIYAVFIFKERNQSADSINKGEDMNQPKLKEIFLYNGNPFVEISKKGKGKNFEIIKQSQGSPLCYKDYNNWPYVITIINENFKFQYFDKITMIFLSAMIYKGKLFRKKSNKSIDEENIAKLDLKGYNFVPLDIKYLNHFYLKNLRILDLSNNSINSEGAFYLSRGKFSSLEK